MWRRFPFGLLKYSLQKEVPPMPIYRHHLQNRRLWVQVLVPLPEKDSDCDTIRVFFNEIHPFGWEKSSSMMKSPAGMKSGSTPDGWI